VGKEKPGLIDSNGRRRDLSSKFQDWNVAFFTNSGLESLAALRNTDIEAFPLVPETERWGSPVARPGKVVCIGLNYSDHAEESGMPIPTEPVIFLKAANTVVGPYDNVLIPHASSKTDWEVELGVIIGKEARYLDSPEDAMACVAGYCIVHDVSERAFQMEHGGQWTKGKSCDTFCPLGPWMATPDEVPNVNSLAMKLWVNGKLQQNGSTAKMIFGVDYLIHYISQFMTLEPGDLISTGTSPGVGLGMKPPVYLKVCDTVELEIGNLGTQRQVFAPTS
jgi:2-keto-4-pentenoate hydratase/2-oxohepta-3-ene-1,7-dioic acid hydratase in catechol pathway